ncbi:hypothetical protein ASC63_10200 [Leifsonia sp. Root112D2]|nr:hypothetical protein ASC63_10200 [Leifsonia sp. Root112D2]
MRAAGFLTGVFLADAARAGAALAGVDLAGVALAGVVFAAGFFAAAAPVGFEARGAFAAGFFAAAPAEGCCGSVGGSGSFVTPLTYQDALRLTSFARRKMTKPNL